MAVPTEIPRSFRLYVTHVDGDGHFLRVSGQLDQPSSLMVESLFKTARENLEKGVGTVSPAAIHEGVICAAKYKDGAYYRAKIVSTTNIATGLVGVYFIDYGNKDIISLSTIRFLDSYDPMFLQLRGQATDYYLSRLMHPSGRWEEPLLLKLQSLLCYNEYPATVDAQTRSLPLISIQFKGNDLSTHLVSNRLGVALPIVKQEVLLSQMTSENQQIPNWQPTYHSESPSYMEHVPFLINQNFPSNPASAMRLQQNVSLPFNGSIPPPSLISQRLLVTNKATRNPVNLRPPSRQPQHASTAAAAEPLTPPPPVALATAKPASPKKSATYKSRLLEANSQHKVFVSFAEEGPELFAVQLATDAQRLQNMMDDINKRPHSSLAEPPMIGTVCLGRMSGDRIICRAIVMNLSGSQCKLFFVDFGDTEMVSYYDIFDIPEEFVKPNVFAMRFCLSGVKKLEKGPHLNETFKQLVNGKVLTLRVVAPEGPPLIQYGELYLDNKNVLDLLMANMKDKLQFKWMGMLPLGTRQSVLVSYVDSCIKFYVQLSDKIDELNAVMDAVKVHCESTSFPGELPVGAACCARFPDDDNWYRARIRDTKGRKVIVVYVDYGNEQEIEISDLRTITPDLIKLPAQALKCALKGFENKPVETKTSNQLEMLALEKTLMAQIVGVLSNDTMLVSLVDDTVSPPLDIARKMNQLSQPRSNHEPKATTPIRKDAPENFSSPEGSVPDDSRKKSFRREKSFKDDRRPPREGNEDFGHRGGSFRGRDNKEAFDRSGPGRHSEKFGGRPDRGDRRGPKPWENNAASSAAPANDEWEEAPAQSFQPPQRQFNRDNRDNRDRDNRDRRGQKPWENKSSNAPAPANDDWEETPAKPAGLPRQFNNRDNRDRDNRRGHKPWENNTASSHAPAADDDWEETPAKPAFQPPRQFNRDNRDRDTRDSKFERRKPRAEHDKPGPRPGWKGKDAAGVGKRLRQAAEAASADAQNARSSVQDRLKRANNFNQDQGDNSNDDWGNKSREGRPDRRDNRGEKRDNWGDKKENWNRDGKRDFNNRERRERPPRSNFSPRDRAERTEKYASDSDKRSERSFRSQDSGRERPPRKFAPQVQYKDLPNPVDHTTAFSDPTVEIGAQHEVSVTWIISPESFYTQIMSLQPKFLEMMHMIPELYKGVKSYSGVIGVGSSVLARYPADGVLYRATVVSVQPFSKYIVRYVDFGNKQLVDAKDIWQLDSQLMDLPKMAVHCSLVGVAPKDGEWKADPGIDLCFNAPRYQCVFQECVEDQYKVSLWNNGVSVADMLVEKELAIMSEHQSSVTLKDEAIDLTIIVGQQILCRVTYVESINKFYVQLDLDKAALVENAIASFDTSKLTPLTAESLAEGIHCTVKHEDKIYRAILNDVSDSSKISAVLPDYGNVITTSLDKLMILPTELSVYYYQSLECCLNNYTEQSEVLLSLDEMKQKLTNNKFIIYINNVEGISLVSTLYDCQTGKKIAIITPDEGAYDEVIPFCMRTVFNYNFGLAYVVHSENLNEIYLHKSADSDKIAQLLDDLYKFYEEGEGQAEPLATFDVDTICAAKSTDGNWYRATVISNDDDQIKVQFSDYGNTEVIPKENLKVLDLKFYEPCSLALVASLGLVALQDDALAKLTEWTTEKEVQVTLAFGNDGWLASLHLDGVDLAMKLVNEKLATPQIASSEEPKAEAPADEPAASPEGCTRVYISHVDTPGHFWLQMADKVDKIEEIQAELQANAESYADVENREMGTLCVAKYLADDQWYRAEILDSDSDITTVRFIDYGNTDVLDNQPGLIKTMPDHFKQIERYAIKSSVNAVPTGTGQWSEPSSDFFTQLVGDFSTAVDALIVLKDVTTYVDIFINGQNLTDKLVSEGYAARSEETECGGDLPSCFASHVNSPSEFWIQLETAAPELQAMESAMVDAENFPELKDKEEGVICAAKYPEDGEWYRAQVIVDGSEGTEVLFMDYGNASIANELRSLPDELKVKPALSRKCALQKPRDIKTWSRKSEIKFNELAAEGATIFNVQFIASGDISIVELYLEGKSVTEELVGLCEEQTEQPVSERPTPVGQDLHSDGIICHVNSVDEFYVQLNDTSADLDKVTDSLDGAAEFEAAPELKVGALCAAFWDDDEQWYRAKILEFCDGAYHVQFIDFGNKAKCDQFRQLPEDLSQIEPLAKCCRLAGITVDSSTSESAKAKLDELASDETHTFRIEFLDSTKEPILVKVFLDGKDVASLISSETEVAKTEAVAQVEDTENVAQVANTEVAQVAKTEVAQVTDTDVVQVDTEVAQVTDTEVAHVVGTETDAQVVETKAEAQVKEGEKVESTAEHTQVETKEPQNEVAITSTENAEPKVEATSTVEPAAKEVIQETSTVVSKQNTDASDSSEKVSVKEVKDTDNIEISKEEGGGDAKEADDEFADAETDLNTSQPDLDESLDSNHTVIENKSFDAKADNLSDDIALASEESSNDVTASPEKNTSSETLENSNDTIKTPEREESKDSINTDTGYTSGDQDKSPSKGSPVKESPTGKKAESTAEVKAVDQTKEDVKKDDVNKAEVTSQ
ncbi:maternal protein tudor-like isoform X2 [Ostrinia nubilalis]|uniref:maternal protein tudor-like isoform X2 n=1 Tax=Ostrinia nubilalis TaxID=29057 RepID=UPI00308265D2